MMSKDNQPVGARRQNLHKVVDVIRLRALNLNVCHYTIPAVMDDRFLVFQLSKEQQNGKECQTRNQE